MSETMEEKIPKPRKKRVAKTKKEQPVNNYETDLKMFITVVTGLIAAQTSEIWEFSEEEISHISKPLSNILERLDITTVAGEYIDYISLVTALAIILTPRIIEQRRRNNEEKAKKSNRGNDKLVTHNTEIPDNVVIQDNDTQN